MISNHERYMISQLCYELYKVDWKRRHMITADREMDTVKSYYETLIDGVSNYGSDDFLDDTEYTYDDYLNDFGYDGELYVCYEEFWDNEYRDEDYICGLLNDEKLIAMYHMDIGE